MSTGGNVELELRKGGELYYKQWDEVALCWVRPRTCSSRCVALMMTDKPDSRGRRFVQCMALHEVIGHLQVEGFREKE